MTLSRASEPMILLRNRNTKLKAGDSFRRQEESWRRAYAEANSLRERFPEIEQVIADMRFTDSKAMGVYSAQRRSFSASAKAFFSIPCPRALCLEGGFHLDTVVAQMIAGGLTTAEGTLECAGWIDASRTQHARCLLRLSYQIEVEYHAPEPVVVARRRT